MPQPADSHDKTDSCDKTEVEHITEVLLTAPEEHIDTPQNSTTDALAAVALAGKRMGIELVRRYNRLHVDAEPTPCDTPVLFVANHGFGGICDLAVFAVYAALEELALDRPVTVLSHQLAWKVGAGSLLEALGARPAGKDSAHEAFADGHHLLVFPGGDLDAFKSWKDRNRVIFGGRTGFARLAMEHGVPIVPIVTAGVGESLMVIDSGERLARTLRLDKLLRLKALPISVTLPWGINVGAAAVFYLPLPSKMQTRVLPALTPAVGEESDAYGARVQAVMQEALTDMTRHRRPLLG